MKSKMRLVTNLDEELLIYLEKQRKAVEKLDYLIVQSLCFQRYEEYFELTKIFLENEKNPNADKLLTSVLKYQYLFDLGLPSNNDINRILSAYKMVNEESKYNPKTTEESELKTMLMRLLIRAIVLDKTQAFVELTALSKSLRSNLNIDYSAFRITLEYYNYLLQLKDK
jgi:hypothetical protein